MRAAALVDPSILLAGETPYLIDEWQMVPDVWNAVRHAVDDRQASGQFILTGSATPTEDVTNNAAPASTQHRPTAPGDKSNEDVADALRDAE